MLSLKGGKEEHGSIFHVNRHQIYTPQDFLFLREERLNNLWNRVYMKINTGVISKALGRESGALHPATGPGLPYR